MARIHRVRRRVIAPRRGALIGVLMIAVFGVMITVGLEEDFGPVWRFRVLEFAIISQTVALVYVGLFVADLIGELRSQHRAATYVNAMIGMADALAEYARQGGDDIEYQLKVHAGIKEQYALYRAAIGAEGPAIGDAFRLGSG